MLILELQRLPALLPPSPRPDSNMARELDGSEEFLPPSQAHRLAQCVFSSISEYGIRLSTKVSPSCIRHAIHPPHLSFLPSSFLSSSSSFFFLSWIRNGRSITPRTRKLDRISGMRSIGTESRSCSTEIIRIRSPRSRWLFTGNRSSLKP